MSKAFIGAMLLVLAVSGGAQAADIPNYVAKAVADSSRPKANTDRDALRLPAETIAFAGVKPGMKVAEFYPSGGYFTRMLSAVVGPKGHVYGIGIAKFNEQADRDMAAEPGRGNVSLQFPAFGSFDLPEKVDLIWITQNYHDLRIPEYGNIDIAAFNKHVYDSLKPGGAYFILDHQGNDGMTLADIGKLHRIPKSQVIREVEAAGFKLSAQGDALHLASDDHTKSALDKSMHDRTDQFMLKFVRP